MWKLSQPSFIMTHDEVLSVTRDPRQIYQGVQYVDGLPRIDVSQASSYPLTCNVQPVSGRDLELLPEGQRLGQQYYLYCPAQPVLPEAGDTFERDGMTFQVQEATFWGNYTRARATNSQALPTLEGFGP